MKKTLKRMGKKVRNSKNEIYFSCPLIDDICKILMKYDFSDDCSKNIYEAKEINKVYEMVEKLRAINTELRKEKVFLNEIKVLKMELFNAEKYSEFLNRVIEEHEQELDIVKGLLREKQGIKIEEVK